MASDFIVLDLFSGAGGLSYGLHMNEHFSTAIALDFNSYATETFKKNMPNTKVITGNILDENIRNIIVIV